MAARRIGDFAIAIAIGIFFISGFAVMLIDFDGQVNSSSVGSTVQNDFVNGSRGSFNATERSFVQSSFNSSLFSLSDNQAIERGGTDQAKILSQDNQGTIKNFIGSAGAFMKADPVVITAIISLVIIISTILFLRVFKGEGI